MNTIVSFRKCTLSDEELLKAVDKGCDGMYTGPYAGRIPTRMIPARPNEDFDLLVGELIQRFIERTDLSERIAIAFAERKDKEEEFWDYHEAHTHTNQELFEIFKQSDTYKNIVG